jgi:hypothetical protein
MTTSSRKPPSREAQNALLGDLESIRSLLEPVATKSALNPEPIEEDIPTLDDIVEGEEPRAMSVGAQMEPLRTDAPQAPAPKVSHGPTGLADDAFDALLGDEWRDAADRILEDARARLEERAGQWSTEDANDFMEALQQRLNGVVHGWLAEVVRRELEDLRETLTAAIGLEIDAFSMRMKDESLDENEGDAE